MQLVGLQNQIKEVILADYMLSGGCEKEAFWTSGSLTSASKNIYTWLVDGSQFSYSNWCMGQPNPYGSESYVLTFSGCWYSAPPQSVQYFICEAVDQSAESREFDEDTRYIVNTEVPLNDPDIE